MTVTEIKPFEVYPNGIRSNSDKPWEILDSDELAEWREDLDERAHADYEIISVIQDGFTPLEETADYSFSDKSFRDIDGRLDEAGQKALEALTERYKGAIHRVANQYTARERSNKDTVADTGDVIQQAFLGLLEAALKWKPGGQTFLSFAMPKMSKQIYGYYDDNATTIRLPRQVRAEVENLRGHQWTTYQKTGKFLWDAVSLSESTGETYPKTVNLLQADSLANQMGTIDNIPGIGAGYSEDDRTQHAEASITKPALMRPIGPDTREEVDSTSEDALKKSAEEYISDLITNNKSYLGLQSNLINSSKDNSTFGLTTREIKVLNLMFGLDGSEPLTLRETGEQLDVTTARARQIYMYALNKIRGKAYKNKLHEMLD